MNWLSLAVSVAVAFCLSPFLVHRLGNTAYGVWVLVSSSTAYLAMLDLGLRGAVVHAIASHHSRGDDAACGRAVSAALWIRVASGLLILLISLILALMIDRLFRIEASLIPEARWAVALSGLCFAVTLSGGIFSGVLAGLQRFDLLSALGVAQVLLNAAGSVWLLNRGYGILALAALQFASAVAINGGQALICRIVFPALRIGLCLDRAMLGKMGHYSFYMFLLSVSGQAIYFTDNVIVGARVSAEAVAFYAIGGRLIEYLRQPVAALAQTFMPLATSLHALEDKRNLRRLLVQGTQVALLIFLPIAAVLAFRGPTFIALWIGDSYRTSSGTVMRILLIAGTAQAGNHVSANIVFGLGKHRKVAQWQILEAVANLGLSLALIRPLGIYGVAWGTVIPELVVQLILWPRYISGLVGVPVAEYLLQAWLRPAIAVVPFAIGCYLADRHWMTGGVAGFMAQTVTLLPLQIAGSAVCFWRDLGPLVRALRSRVASSDVAGVPVLENSGTFETVVGDDWRKRRTGV